MRSTLRILSLILMSMLLISVFSACGKTPAGSGGSEPSSSEESSSAGSETTQTTSSEAEETAPVSPFAVTQDDEICNYFAINANGLAVQAAGYGCTSFLPLDGADTLTVSMVESTSFKHGLAFYDANRQFISFVASPKGTATAKKMVTIEVPENAVYFKTSYFGYAQRQKHGDFCYVLEKDGQVIDQAGKKRDYQDGYIYFSREVSQTLDVSDTGKLNATTGVLALPKNYTADGEPTKLIIYFHGLRHFVHYGTWSDRDAFLEQKEHYLERGYAVLDCNGPRDNNRKGRLTSAGSPQYVDGYYQCYQYAIQHYNLDAEVYVVGGSAGGPAAINFTRWHQENVKALQLMSTWTDLKTCSWEQNIRDTFVEYLGFANEDTYEEDKTLPYDPKFLIQDGKLTEITVPINGIIGSEESKSKLYDPFIQWMDAAVAANSRNKLTIWEGKDHSLVSGGDPVIDTAVCDFFDSIP